MSRRVAVNCDDLQGFFNIELDEEDYKEFKTLTKKEQIKYIMECGDLIITVCRVADNEIFKDDGIEGDIETIYK